VRRCSQISEEGTFAEGKEVGKGDKWWNGETMKAVACLAQRQTATIPSQPTVYNSVLKNFDKRL